MAAAESTDGAERARASVRAASAGAASVSTGLPILDHLLGLLARYGRLELTLDVAPGAALDEAAAAGRALGEALAPPLGAPGAEGHGSAVLPADEALAHVVVEASGRPLVVSNVDLSAARVGGVRADLVARFLDELARGAGLTVHVRLLEGEEAEHVLDAIFKALGAALAEAARPRTAKE